MSKFQVCIKRSEWAYFIVDAPTMEEASEVAIDDAYDDDWHHSFDCDYEVGSIEEVDDE